MNTQQINNLVETIQVGEVQAQINRFEVPLGKDFIVTFQDTRGAFSIFFESFRTVSGREKMFYGRDVSKSFRFTRANAEGCILKLEKQFRHLKFRVEAVDAKNNRTPVPMRLDGMQVRDIKRNDLIPVKEIA